MKLTHETKRLNKSSKNYLKNLNKSLNNGWFVDIDYKDFRIVLKRKLRKNITKYSSNELLLIVSNTEKYYDLFYSNQFDHLYKLLKNNYIYTQDQLTSLENYILNK